MKTIIHEGIAATVHVNIEGYEQQIDLDFQVLPNVGDAIKVGNTSYLISTHIVTQIEHQVLIGDKGNYVYIHIRTVPAEDK